MTSEPYSQPLYVMTKAAGSACNLRCRYCYYLEKSKLYPGGNMMSEEMLDRFIKQYIEAQPVPQVLFTWHGGEPLLRGLDFYKKALQLQRYHSLGMRVDNCIQTNGMLLTDEWCRFFRDNGWLVGLSIDGPRELHDAYRHKGDGKGSFDDVMRGIELLNRHGVEWNAMAVVNDVVAAHPDEFYDFFKAIDCRYIQFTPIVERLTGDGLATVGDEAQLAPFSVSPDAWGEFLCRVFDRWVVADVGKVFVQLFDATLANHLGVTPGLCSMARTCGHAVVLEHNGDLYSCDHFVFPQYRLGNIRSKTIFEMLNSDRQLRFGQDKHDRLPRRCLTCQYLSLCNGECPKNRFAYTVDGEPGQNYLCRGYSRFFAHSHRAMTFMAAELRVGRAPANVMGLSRR